MERTWLKKGLAIAGVLATLATIAGGVNGYLQYKLAREEANRAATPRLLIVFVDQNDPDFLGIILRNAGSGRAELGEIDIFVDGERLGSTTEQGWRPVLRRLGLDRQDVHTLSMSSTVFLKGDSDLRLLGVLKKELTPESFAALYAVRRRIQFSGCYCSETQICKPLLSPGLTDNPCSWGNPQSKAANVK